jgi:hypothetical protein
VPTASVVALALGVSLLGGPAAGSPPPDPTPLPARPVAGGACPDFPSDNWWHADIRGLPVHRRSDAWISHMSPGSRLHPDFGDAFGAQPVPYGLPITVVGAAHSTVRVRFRYASESDRVRYPLGPDTRIEGGRRSQGDRHAIVVDRSSCRLYELFDARKADGRWRAGSGAVWDLRSNRLRPRGWTSADAAGLPILPGLLRLGEVRSGRVDHAIRFTTDVTDRRYLWPARHQAGSVTNRSFPPMGARFRLKRSFDLSGYRHDTRVVLRAMKTYGLVLADNGSPWYFQGARSRHWPHGLLDELKTIPARAFVAVDTSSLRVSRDSAQVVTR